MFTVIQRYGNTCSYMDICTHCGSTDLGNGLFCPHCKYHIKGRTFSNPQAPPWGASESGIYSQDTATQIKATDEFLDQKAKITATSSKWANWEKGRKQEWQKNKGAWKKKRAASKGAV